MALAHGTNANIVCRWLRERTAAPAPKPVNPFISLNLPQPEVEDIAPVHAAGNLSADIRVEIRRGTGALMVSWPVKASSSCADWLRDWLR